MTLAQNPAQGSFHIHRCGDVFQLKLTVKEKSVCPYLRTSLGGAKKQREALITKTEQDLVTSRNNWIDIPFDRLDDESYQITLPLYEVGYFEAKIWFSNEDNDKIKWAPGDNVFIKVEPASTIANNSIYGIFTRQFGPNKEKAFAINEDDENIIALDKKEYSVIPPSGKFRDVIKELDHIMDDMGFRILQLLPIHPTPTTFARMGRFGSPYAGLDFFAVDPALAEFDKKTTPLDQFIELVDAVHARNGEVFLDIPVDHTGWASTLQKDHPEYFVQNNEGDFMSPGAWGTTWEDLVKLDFNKTEVHQMMADVFLYWCRKGVNGFRCDAGYMVPFDAWEYIIAKVRHEFPNIIFLLEGLGGPPEVTEELLAKATFTWAYSELFQNYSKEEVTNYTNTMLQTSYNKGGLVNFSETHDNTRMAATSNKWSQMRNQLCALTAPGGGFGISNGVEFFAKERISVHNASGLNWGNTENQVSLMKRFTTLFKVHPAFYSDAHIKNTDQDNNYLYTCKRTAKNGDQVLIIVNLSCERDQKLTLDKVYANKIDLLTGKAVTNNATIEAGQAMCIDNTELYSTRINEFNDADDNNVLQIQRAKETLLIINAHINGFKSIESNYTLKNLETLLTSPLEYCLQAGASLGEVVHWNVASDANRLVMASSKSILLIHSESDFNYSISSPKNKHIGLGNAITKADKSFFALVPMPKNKSKETELLKIKISCKASQTIEHMRGQIALLPKGNAPSFRQAFTTKEVRKKQLYGLCTNKSGSMSQVSGIWGEFNSKYDSFFAANLDKTVPVDRTALISRWRCWVVFNNFSHELSEKSQYRFAADGATNISWSFKAPTGQGKFTLLNIHLEWCENTEQASLSLMRKQDNTQADLLDLKAPVTIILRPDLEYRSNHEVSKAFTGLEALFPSSVNEKEEGFIFDPYNSSPLHVEAKGSQFHVEPEWQYMHHLAVEAERGLESATDLFSPGYFKFELRNEQCITINTGISEAIGVTSKPTPISDTAPRESVLKQAMQRFIVRRDDGQTVIAGYPWFLDWGRDTLICLRGIISADMKQEARDIILTFAKYEIEGTLPNMIRGNNASNRDTSDAPLWFIVAIKDYIEHFNDASVLDMNCAGRNVKDVIKSIVENYAKGTKNGIRMDEDSALIYSPSHFTWMDTNYPAGTPRIGYPIEIQSFWQASVSFLNEIDDNEKWSKLATKIKTSITTYYPLGNNKGFADCLHTEGFQPAKEAIKDNACRPNQLFAVTLNVISDETLIKSILVATQSLIIPGAIRSLKDAPISPELPVYRDGQLLNNPAAPYWGNYTGDEDTRRKPAYHNGTAWAWPFFSYCEALYRHTKDTTNSLAILMSAKTEMEKGIINHMPEISDGNSPHQQRGCLAQAWSITEYYRVLQKIIKNDQH